MMTIKKRSLERQIGKFNIVKPLEISIFKLFQIKLINPSNFVNVWKSNKIVGTNFRENVEKIKQKKDQFTKIISFF